MEPKVDVQPQEGESALSAYEREVGYIVTWADNVEGYQLPLPLGETQAA